MYPLYSTLPPQQQQKIFDPVSLPGQLGMAVLLGAGPSTRLLVWPSLDWSAWLSRHTSANTPTSLQPRALH